MAEGVNGLTNCAVDIVSGNATRHSRQSKNQGKGVWLLCRLVGDGKEIAGSVVRAQEPHYVVKAERPRTAAAEHGDLISALVGGTVAIEAF